jgi:hypothetical protein
LTGEKILDTRFLIKEEPSRNTVCSFTRNNRRYWSEIRSISTKLQDDDPRKLVYQTYLHTQPNNYTV